MITGFEDHTKPLSPEEQIIVSFLLKLFQTKRILHVNKISSPDLCTIVKRKYELETFPDSRLRKCINYIRRNGLCPIVSDNRGYWLAESEAEVQKCIQSLQDRIDSMSIAKQGMEDMLLSFRTAPKVTKTGKLF